MCERLLKRKIAQTSGLILDRWPTQARFWLERGCSDLRNSVIPTGADHRKAMIRGVESLP